MYHSLDNYEQNTLSPQAHNHAVEKKTKKKKKTNDAWLERRRRQRGCGMGVDRNMLKLVSSRDEDMEETEVMIHVNPYDEHNPYLYQFSPYYAEFPYGFDYHDEFGDKNKYLPIFPSYPSADSSTRVYYRDFPIVKLRVPEYLEEDSMGT